MEVYLTYNVLPITDIQQNDSDIYVCIYVYIYIYIYIYILFHYRLLQDQKILNIVPCAPVQMLFIIPCFLFFSLKSCINTKITMKFLAVVLLSG